MVSITETRDLLRDTIRNEGLVYFKSKNDRYLLALNFIIKLKNDKLNSFLTDDFGANINKTFKIKRNEKIKYEEPPFTLDIELSNIESGSTLDYKTIDSDLDHKIISVDSRTLYIPHDYIDIFQRQSKLSKSALEYESIMSGDSHRCYIVEDNDIKMYIFSKPDLWLA